MLATETAAAPLVEPVATQNADNWVQCDRCGKWRRVGASVVDNLDDNANWFCEDNPDETHNSCTQPQELTNEEIDRGREEDDILERERRRRQRRPAVWQLIKDNIYTHRKQKKLYEDDIMVCACQPPPLPGATPRKNVSENCGLHCLNRMLNIECIAAFCPCARDCRNQRFSRKQYARVETRRAGLKGFGLFTIDDLTKGQFILEYVGEVLDEDEYVRRKEYYTSVGQRHYYFMNIGNGEVIDACRKGNRARFINHSCEPNCETQKWVVKGELAIGLFATANIPAGSELTFDYNFERYGDKPTKCHCAAPKCRGFIGGSADRYEGLAVDDAALLGEDMQPIMVAADVPEQDLNVVLDHFVGINLDLRFSKVVDRQLRELALAQGVKWESDEDAEESAHDESALTDLSKSAFAEVAAPGILAEVCSPPARAPSKKRARPSDGAPKRGGAKAAKTPAAVLPAALPPSLPPLPAFPPPARPSAAPQKPRDAEAEDAMEEALSEDSGITLAEEVEEDDWLDSDDRYKEAPVTEPVPPRPKQRLKAPAAKPPRPGKPGAPAGRKADVVRRGTPILTLPPPLPRAAAPPAARPIAAPPSTPKAAAPLQAPSLVAPPAGSQPCDAAAAAPRPDSATAAPEPPAERAALPAESPPVVTPPRRRIIKSVTKVKAARPAGEAAVAAPSARADSSGAAPSEERSVDAADGVLSRLDSSAATDAGAMAAGGAKPPLAPALKRTLPQQPHRRPPGAAGAVAGDRSMRKRSEVDRRMDALLDRNRRLKKDSVVNFVRLFNMCDISPAMKEDVQVQDGQALMPRNKYNLETEKQLSSRQKARFADLQLLLDRALATAVLTLQKELVRCGILSRLMWCVGHNFGAGYAPVVRKVLRVVEHLPFTTEDMYSKRSAHGSFVDLLHDLHGSFNDFEVRKRAAALLNRFKPPPGFKAARRRTGGVLAVAAPGQGQGQGHGGGMRGPPDALHRGGSGADRHDSATDSDGERRAPRGGAPRSPLPPQPDALPAPPPRAPRGGSGGIRGVRGAPGGRSQPETPLAAVDVNRVGPPSAHGASRTARRRSGAGPASRSQFDLDGGNAATVTLTAGVVCAGGRRSFADAHDGPAFWEQAANGYDAPLPPAPSLPAAPAHAATYDSAPPGWEADYAPPLPADAPPAPPPLAEPAWRVQSRPPWAPAAAAAAFSLQKRDPTRFQPAPPSDEACGQKSDLIEGLLLGIYARHIMAPLAGGHDAYPPGPPPVANGAHAERSGAAHAPVWPSTFPASGAPGSGAF